MTERKKTTLSEMYLHITLFTSAFHFGLIELCWSVLLLTTHVLKIDRKFTEGGANIYMFKSIMINTHIICICLA